MEQFTQAFQQKDTLKQFQVLKEWRKAAPEDPQLYIDWFNFYVFKARHEVIAMTAAPATGGQFSIQDKSGKEVGNLHGEIGYDDKIVQQGIAYIDTGILKFPDRLDMRFGKTFILGQIDNYSGFTNTIIAAFNHGNKIHMKWLWTGGKPLDDPEKFMLSTAQTYINQLYNEGPDQLGHMRSVVQVILKYFPNDVPNLSNLAITYIMDKDYKSALTSLLKAATITPSDSIVLNNIAYCYAQVDDKPNAIKYYQLTVKYGDADAKEFAGKKLKELKGN